MRDKWDDVPAPDSDEDRLGEGTSFGGPPAASGNFSAPGDSSLKISTSDYYSVPNDYSVKLGDPYEFIPKGRGVICKYDLMDRRLLLTPEKPAEKSEGGIFVEQEAAPVGVVVEPKALEGRRVLYLKYSGTQVTINDEDFLIVEGDNILMFLADDDKVEP